MTFHFQICKISAMQWMQALGYCQDLYNIFAILCNLSLGSLEDISPAQIYHGDLNSVIFFLCCYVFSKWNIFLYFSLFRSYSFLSLSFPVQSSFFYPSALSILEYPKLSLSPFCLFLLLCSTFFIPVFFLLWFSLFIIIYFP